MAIVNLKCISNKKENRLVDTLEEGEGGINWESSIEKHTLSHAKQIASEIVLYDAGNSNLVLWDNLEEWDGMGGEREVQEGGNICIFLADSCWHMAETKTIL